MSIDDSGSVFCIPFDWTLSTCRHLLASDEEFVCIDCGLREERKKNKINGLEQQIVIGEHK